MSSRIAGLSAALLVLVAACSSGGGSAHSRASAASTPLTPRQALLAAADQSQRVTSATETLTVRGAQGVVATGTIKLRLKPTFQVSENLKTIVAGKNTDIKIIIIGTVFYLSEPTLTRQLGKPWIKIDPSTVKGTPLAGLAQFFHSLQNNNFVNETELLSVAKNTRVVGTEAVDGVPTTEYAGSFHVAEALKALSPSFRTVMAPGLRALGNSTVRFYIWIDGQHHTRKVTDVETVNGETITTTVLITAINQPVQIEPPPASQILTPPGI